MKHTPGPLNNGEVIKYIDYYPDGKIKHIQYY
jgi:hypothetical protein